MRALGLDAAAQSTPAIDGPAGAGSAGGHHQRSDGQATVRAIKLTAPLKVDGSSTKRSTRARSRSAASSRSCRSTASQQTERTEAWVMFDDDNIYVAAGCWDSAPPDKWIANELRRDTNQLRQNDQFGVMFDTFHDRRNGFLFYTNPLGARAD